MNDQIKKNLKIHRSYESHDAEESRMRGFVITILSVFLVVLLVVLVISLRNTQLSTERALLAPLPLMYGSSLLDNSAGALNSIVGPQLSLDSQNDSFTVNVADRLTDYNYSAELYSFGSFLSGDIAGRTASEITLNLTNLTQGVNRLMIADEYGYTNDHLLNKTTFFRSGGTNARSYEVNLSINAVRSTVTHMTFNSSGTLNVTITYHDLNGTDVEEGKVFPNQLNQLRIDYPSGASVVLTIGPSGGSDGSLIIQSTKISTQTSWSALLPRLNATQRLGYVYDGTIAYRQGDVLISKNIGR